MFNLDNITSFTGIRILSVIIAINIPVLLVERDLAEVGRNFEVQNRTVHERYSV